MTIRWDSTWLPRFAVKLFIYIVNVHCSWAYWEKKREREVYILIGVFSLVGPWDFCPCSIVDIAQALYVWDMGSIPIMGVEYIINIFNLIARNNLKINFEFENFRIILDFFLWQVLKFHVKISFKILKFKVLTDFVSIIRSYHSGYTGSHPNSEVKQGWAYLVLWWGTTRES